jgi:hypothetical protein
MALRAMSGVDLNPLSKTYGCADRGYWHYQDGKGFPVGSMQVSTLGFWAASHLLNADFRAASLATIDWWVRIIEAGDGSLDEYFFGQRSFCATAYCAMAVATVLHDGGEGITTRHREALQKTLKYLASDKHRPDSANQTFAAMVAYDLSGLKGTNPFSPHFVTEGAYYSEYGGFDLGYTLKCVDICALAIGLVKEDSLREKYFDMSDKLIDRLSNVIVEKCFHPSLGSRGNSHLLLGGLTYFQRNGHPRALAVLDALTKSHRFSDLVTAENCDDKYLSFFHLTSLSLSADITGKLFKAFQWSKPLASLPSLEQEENLYWYKNKLVVSKNSPRFHVELLDKQFTFGGWVATNMGETWVSCGHIVKDFSVENKNGALVIKHPIMFVKMKSNTSLVQSWWFSLALRVSMRVPFVGQVLRNMIYQKSMKAKPGIKWGEREIRIVNKEITIKDKFDLTIMDLRFHRGWVMTPCNLKGNRRQIRLLLYFPDMIQININ